MNIFALITALLPIVEEITKAITDAIAAGRQPADVHQMILDHAAQLPAKIREQ